MDACASRTSIRSCPSVKQPASQNRQRRIRCCCSAVEDVADRVVVAGGGIGGLATAVALTRCEIPVMVLEKSEILRQEGAALVLQANGWRALDVLSVAEKLRQMHPQCRRLQFFTNEGRALSSFEFKDGTKDVEVRGVMRKRLLQGLADSLPEDCIQFESSVISVDLKDADRPIVQLEDGRKLRCRALVGADGVGSKVASALGLPSPTYQGNCGMRAVSEFNEVPLPPQTTYYYLGNGDRVGMYQVEDRKVYWFIAYNAPEDVKMENEEAVFSEAKRRASSFQGPLRECLDNLIPGTLSFAKLSDRLMLPFETPGYGNVTLVGDAFHPMTPNLGQGGGLALEDAIVLARNLMAIGGLEASDATLATALRNYERERAMRASVVTLRSRVVGKIFSIPFSPVVAVRNMLIANSNMSDTFASTTRYDCGSLRA